MIINNYYDVSIIIGSLDLLNSGSASNVTCMIKESISTSFPVCKLSFIAPTQLLNQCSIVDGTNIIITIKSQLFEINEQYNFRVYDVKAQMNGNNLLYTIEGFLNFYELFRDPNKYALFGNSSDVFAGVAKKNNIESAIHQTKDVQLWVPSQQNLGKWLGCVANHGWRSDQSGMYWFINRKSKLYYIDIDQLINESKGVARFQFGETLPEDIPNKIYKYKSFSLRTSSGEENIFNGGYNGKLFHFDLMNYDNITENANKVRAYSKIVNINKELSQGSEETYLQFDVGNHHDKYFLAEFQNKRVLSTFSSYVTATMERFRDISLSQVCTLNASMPSSFNSTVDSFDTKYIVSDIIISITNVNLSMQVRLCTQGFNGTSTESY